MKRMAHFKHLIVPGVTLLGLIVLFAALGFWQLERADENRAVFAQFEQGTSEPPLDRPVSAAELDSQRYRRISLRGRYLAGQQILLDNMTHAGRAGYQVLTPFDIGDERLILVNRGWVPADPDRDIKPDVALANEHGQVLGRLDRLPRSALSLDAGPLPAGAALAVVSFPKAEDIEAILGQAVFPLQVLLDPEAPDGYVRDWVPATDRADRNIAYAVQWFGLAAVSLLIAVVLGIRSLRPQREVR